MDIQNRDRVYRNDSCLSSNVIGATTHGNAGNGIGEWTGSISRCRHSNRCCDPVGGYRMVRGIGTVVNGIVEGVWWRGVGSGKGNVGLRRILAHGSSSRDGSDRQWCNSDCHGCIGCTGRRGGR